MVILKGVRPPCSTSHSPLNGGAMCTVAAEPPMNARPRSSASTNQRVLEQEGGGWHGRWHAQDWWRSMERYVLPASAVGPSERGAID